jgi:hypothetical protein
MTKRAALILPVWFFAPEGAVSPQLISERIANLQIDSPKPVTLIGETIGMP